MTTQTQARETLMQAAREKVAASGVRAPYAAKVLTGACDDSGQVQTYYQRELEAVAFRAMGADMDDDAIVTTSHAETDDMRDLLPPRRVPMPIATLAAWLADIAAGTWSWTRNTRCKYVTLRIDTRNGAYAVLDRDDKELSDDELLWQYVSRKPVKA